MRSCDYLKVREDTYTGTINITSEGEDPAGDFLGSNDLGIYTFEWCNSQTQCSVDFDVTNEPGGTVQIIVRDDTGAKVLDKKRPTANEDSFSGVSDNGEAGIWTVTILFEQFDGDGSWSIHPGD